VPTLQEVTSGVSNELESVERTLGLPDLPDEEDLASLVDSAESGVSRLVGDGEALIRDSFDTADNVFESLQQNVQDSVDTATETISGEIDTAVTTLDEIQGNVADFDGVTLPDIDSSIDGLLDEAETVDAAIDTRINSLESELGLTDDGEDSGSPFNFPTVDDIVSDVVTAIETQIIPEREDVLLTDDVPLFLAIVIDDFLQQALSEETQQDLADAAERAP
jgi:ElaB/YqjD/DUF883 family membrane-anchored ribosome-binding protein